MRILIVALFLFSLAGCTPNPQDAKENTVSSEKEYHNPVDKRTYVPKGGWQTYKPKTPQDTTGKKVIVDNIRLLTSNADIEARIVGSDTRAKARAMAVFVKEAQQLAEIEFAGSKTPFRLLVQFACTPTEHTIKMASQGKVSEESLKSYYKALVMMKKLPIKTGEVSFQFEVTVNP